MKVEIKLNGMMVILAENDTEAYTLNKWMDGYKSKGSESLQVGWDYDNEKERPNTVSSLKK